MNSAKLNTIAGAVLFVLLVTMGLGILSDIIFAPSEPDKPGYEIVIAAADDEAEAEVIEPDVPPIGVRLASASAEDGEKLIRACASCHAFEQGGPNKVGPVLWNVVDRQPAGVDGFRYSGAMQDYGDSTEAWSYDNLDAFLAAPKQLVAGTSMGYAGMRKPEDRANLIAYLRTLSDEPVPLPDAAQ
ncbi:c-type cytochrome [Stappia stellulata]|uniref:c-type cytochrome n=1 Tax=Stappia stellulata TaxID=71235 RepID=UPI000421464A|nr:cytochrome c family protein [Stappia stellulata]